MVAPADVIRELDLVGEAFERVQPDEHTVLFVPEDGGHDHDADPANADQTGQPAPAHAADEHHHQTQRRQQDRAGEVRLDDDESAGDAKDQQQRHQTAEKLFHPLMVERDQVREQQHQCELSYLRRLELPEAGDADPAVHTGGRRRDIGDDQQHERGEPQQPREPVQDVIIDHGGEEHRRHADHDPQQLPADIVIAVAFIGERVHMAGRIQRGQPDDQDHHQQHEKRHIEPVGQVEEPQPTLGLSCLFAGGGQRHELCFLFVFHPVTRSFPPFFRCLCVQPQQHCAQTAEQRHGREHDHDLVLAPAAQLEVVMQRAHPEQALPMGELEVSDL